MNIDLSGQIAVVTGASRGIGASVAGLLGSCGAHVIVNYKSSLKMAEAVVESIQNAGGSAEVMGFDVADEAQVKQSIKRVAEQHSRIDILVNNAGVSKDFLLLRVKPGDFQELVDINLKGAVFCASHAARYMIKQKRGRIITMSSVVGLGGNAGQSVYAATKAGLIGFTKSLAKELGPRGILVNAVAPGLIETDMSRDIDRQAIGQMIPLGRMGMPEDVAGAVLFLCSVLGSYMTGQVLVVDGGLYT